MKYVDELCERYPILSDNKAEIEKVCDKLIKCFESLGKLLVCGNGGSCADAEHITGELMKGFLKKRPISPEKAEQMKNRCPEIEDSVIESLQQGLPTIALDSHGALNTAFMNDCNPDLIYAQQVLGYGREGDTFIGISTSGNAKNVCAAATVAKSLGMYTVALAGRDGGKLAKISDDAIIVKESETFKIQELHLPVYHAICAEIEDFFFKE